LAIRIGGLASGMDIDTLVADLMKAERIPYEKLTKSKQKVEWQRDAYREMNTSLLNFRTQTFNMKLSTNYRARSVTSSNDSKVTAVAKSAADLSSFNISKIDQLASAATKVNTGTISKTDKIDATSSLYNIKDTFSSSNFGWTAGSVETRTITTAADGTTFKLTLSDGVQLQQIANQTAVKVDGKSYTVVTGDGVTPKTGEVHLDTLGNLTFTDTIKKGSSIKVDFAADKKIDTFTPSAATSEIQLTKGSVSLNDEIVLNVGGVEYRNNGSNNNELLAADNSVFATIDSSGKISFTNQVAQGTDIKVEYKQNYFAFDIGSHTSKGQVNERFLVQGSESLNSVLSKISSSTAGVSAFYDTFSDRVTLTRKETGDFNTGLGQEIITSSGFLNDVLKFEGSSEEGGKNAQFTINGLSTERTSNTFDISGVTFTLKDKLLEGEPPISINISNDTDKVVENIVKFVNSYNELIANIQTKVNETKYRDYDPLTDEERESLSETQQEKWDEMAKSGLLKGDSTLSSLLSKMRNDFYSPVSNSSITTKYNQLSNLGITTSSNYLDGGKLIIDEDKLRAAIEEDPSSVEKLFTSSGTTSGEKGILTRLYDSVTTAMDNIKTKAGSSNSTNSTFTLGRNLNSIEDQIERFEDRLQQIEDRYWAQFTAMEKAIQQSNSQMSYMMQQFSY